MKHYKIKEVAQLVGRSPRTVRDWIETGCKTSSGHVQLEAVKIGRWWSVPEESLVLFQYRLKTQSTTRTTFEAEQREVKDDTNR